MKFLNILLMLILFFSCEENDICTEQSTSRMIIKFKNSISNSTIQLDSILVKRLDSKDSNVKNVAFIVRDSMILVPLSLNDSKTKLIISSIVLKKEDTINLEYKLNQRFISKSCGFIINYTDIKSELKLNSNSFIKKIEQHLNEISNENDTIITIFN